MKTLKTGIKILLDNDKEGAKELIKILDSEKIPFNNPKRHARMLGYPYNKGDFEADTTSGIRRLMVELKILSIYGKHTCPSILLVVNKNSKFNK